MALFNVFRRLMCTSVGPLLHSYSRAAATVHHSRDVVLCEHRVFPRCSRTLRNPRVQCRATSSRGRRPRRARRGQTRNLPFDNRRRHAPRPGGGCRRRSLGAGIDAADGWNAVRCDEYRSSDVHRCRWGDGDLGPAGELLAGSARHTCGPDRRAARGVDVFFAKMAPADSASLYILTQRSSPTSGENRLIRISVHNHKNAHLTAALSYLGLRWVAYGLISALGVGAVYVHAWWLPRHGINGWTGEPKEKYYALLGVRPRRQDRTG